MSSTYRVLCLAHDPAITIDGWESQSPDEVVGLLERRDTAEQLAQHRGCPLAVGRYSYPLIQVYNPKTRQWADVEVLRLIIAAHDADLRPDLLAQLFRRGWDMAFLEPLRAELSVDR